MLPITSPYRLTVVCFYRHLYTKYIWITYNITYKGSLYFGIPGVQRSANLDRTSNSTTRLSQRAGMNMKENVHVICGGNVVFARQWKDIHKQLLKTEWRTREENDILSTSLMSVDPVTIYNSDVVH
jgi:hypothetical protein